jgi:dienelactone hydrolase
MRAFEIAGTVGLLLCGSYLLLQPGGSEIALALLVGFVAFVLGFQARREGWRWQMSPAYFLVAALVLYGSAHWLFGYRAPLIAGGAVVVFALVAIAACIVMPVFQVPAPTGPYKIGTQIRHIVDEDRRDLLSDNPNARRELVIQIWYPAKHASGQARMSRYRDRRITTLKDAHLALVRTHAMLDAPIHPSSGGFPVLVYTPSWSGTRTECTIQIEEMASHGYVVVAIDHPYCSRVMAFPDGRIVRRNFDGDEDYSSDEAVARFVRAADEQVTLRAEDARFVLNTLERLNRRDPDGLLGGRLALDRVGIFGFSLGGGTAAQACLIDKRFKAGVDMGGMIAGDVPTKGIPIPFFFMFEGMYEAFPFVPKSDVSTMAVRTRLEIEFVWRQFEQMKGSLARFGGYWMVINGIRHRDFCDAPFFSPLRRSHASSLLVCRTISRYILAYFNKHVRNTEQASLDDPSRRGSFVRFEQVDGTARTDDPRCSGEAQI